MSGKWHLICCLFCCSTLAVINLCPLLLFFFFFLYIYFLVLRICTHLYLLFIINVYSIIYCLTTRRHVYIFNLCIILLNCVIEWGWLRINHSTLIAAANWVNNNCNNTATTTTITVLVTRLAHSLALLTPLSYTHRHILTLICINWAQNEHED